MIALSLTLLLYVVSSPAWALQGDIAEALSSPLAAQENPVRGELSQYLNQDDIQGALAFIKKLANDGDIDAKRQRALEDVVWRTKTQRMLDYSKKIREAIKISDLEAMRDYNRRLQRLRDGAGPDTELATPSIENRPPARDEEPSDLAGSDLGEPNGDTTEPVDTLEDTTPVEPVRPLNVARRSPPNEAEADETVELSEIPAVSEVQGPAGGPVLGFPPARTAVVTPPEPVSEVSLDAGVSNGVERRPVRLGNVPRRTRHQTLIDDLISDLLERGHQAIAAYHLTVAPDGTDSALGIVEKLLIMGSDGEPAAEDLGQKILTAYEGLVQRDLSLGLYDKASAFIDRMDEVAETAGLPRDEIDALRAQLDAAS